MSTFQDTDSCGLTQETIEKIRAVFTKYSRIVKVVLYGSRAKGNFHNGSDVDLTIFCDDPHFSELGNVELEIDDLNLPYKVDLSLFQHIDNQALRDHIERIGVVFYLIKNQNDI